MSKVIVWQFNFIFFLLWAVILLNDKYANTLYALILIFFSIIFDWRLYKSKWEEIKILHYLSGKTHIFIVIFLTASYIIQNQYKVSKILPDFNNVSKAFFICSYMTKLVRTNKFPLFYLSSIPPSLAFQVNIYCCSGKVFRRQKKG